MDDKDFLNYFSQLGNKNVDSVKQASNNIVSTLLALDTKVVRRASMDSLQDDDDVAAKGKVESSIRAKYQQGDLGAKMTADLNYALKRLVRGLYSDNHAVKQGFFLASVMVLNRFKDQIDCSMFLRFIKAETNTNEGMKNAERHSMMLGRMMCYSAIIESGWIKGES